MRAQYQPIIDRFHADAAFREAVLADANGAVKREFGIDLPGQVRVVSEASGYRVEPVVGAGGDLSDAQLELVSGGKGGSASSGNGYGYGGMIGRPPFGGGFRW